jgi:hypothetical protein
MAIAISISSSVKPRLPGGPQDRPRAWPQRDGSICEILLITGQAPVTAAAMRDALIPVANIDIFAFASG